MKATLKKCRSRLKSRGGFSLAEVLITILILLLVTVIVAEGVPTALRAYDRIVTAANAQALLSTTMTKLRNELSTASDVKVGEDHASISFTDDDGLRVNLYLGTLSSGEKGICITETYGVTDETASTTPRLLISEAASNRNLYVTYAGKKDSDGNVLTPAVDYSGGVVTFSNLSVKSNNADDKVLAKIDTYEIRVLSGSAS